MDTKNNLLIKIQFAILIPEASKQNDLTWPNRYSKKLAKFSDAISAISKLQANIAEIYREKEIVIRDRMLGLFDGHIITIIKSIDEIKESPYLIKVLFTDEAQVPYEQDQGIIAVICGENPECRTGQIHCSQLTPELFKQKVLDLISTTDKESIKVLEKLKSYENYEPGFNRIKTDIRVSPSFYTSPMLATLESLRITIDKANPTSEYRIEEIITLVNLTNKIRTHISKKLSTTGIPTAVNYYITDSSSSLEFANSRSSYTQASLRNRGIVDPKSLISAIQYSDRGKTNSEDPENHYIAQLKTERKLLDSLITISSSKHVAPVIRLPLCNTDIYQQVRDLADADRGNGKKATPLTTKLKLSLSKHLNEWLEYLENSPSAAIKLISNLPLEWAFHQGLPLIVRHETSRIPITPGYVTTQRLLDPHVAHLSLNDFREILFISSFADGDPIRDDLRSSLEVIQNLPNRALLEKAGEMKAKGLLPSDLQIPTDSRIDVKIKWVEVSNKTELIKAINGSTCAITVFDLHGNHDEQGGTIQLKNEKVSVFDIYQEIRVSPIVILSSCDTSPIDKGHDSTAEAFFLAGAKTLISSALPIRSDLASTFIARLLERIKTYLPTRVRHEGPIRWSTFVSGMIRRTYYYELVSSLQKKLNFDNQKKCELLFKIGTLIDPLSRDWVQETKNEICKSIEIETNHLDEFIENNAQFMECMKYLQMGSPESIIISENREY